MSRSADRGTPKMKGLVVLLLCSLAVAANADAIKLQSVERKISLNSQFVRITESYKVKNTGNDTCSTLDVFWTQVSQAVASGKQKLQYAPASISGAPDAAVCWDVQLKEQIKGGDVGSLELFTVLADAQVPNPAEIGQGEKQLMEYHDNVYVITPYIVSTQTTEVTFPTANIKLYTDTEKPVAKASDKVLRFGKYDLIKPWTMAPLKLHFENNKAFKKAVSCVREIEVSHWGNIYVEESYELKNAGAKHKGSFSRLRYAHTPDGRGNAFQDLKAKLPASAHSLYYVDIIGNISTSAVSKTGTETTLNFLTRYPLMGGWKVDFKIAGITTITLNSTTGKLCASMSHAGYSVPLQGFLHRLKGGKRRLIFDVSTPIEGVYVEDLTVKVVLPEGATGITPSLPYDMEQSYNVKYTYLDINGRPVLVLHKRNVVPDMAAKLTVDYHFPATGVLREPLMLIAAFATLFVCVIAYNRLEFTIARDDKWQAGQDAEKLASVMQQINAIMEEQDEVLDSLAELTAGICNTQNAEASGRERVTQEASYNALESKAKALINVVAASQPRVAEKVSALQERLKAVQQRMLRHLADRCDLVRKGTSLSEVNTKLAPTLQAIKEAKRDLASSVETCFAPY